MNEFVRKFEAVDAPWSKEEFEAKIRAVGAERYHDKHPFHKLLHGGKLTKGQVQAWALNRYCYQEAVPRKDAALISRVHDRELRREWLHRMHDHDGLPPEEPGGIERWLVLTDGLGLDRDYVTSMQGALPATRFAVEAYVRFVRRAAADRRGRLLADRAVRALDPPRAHRRHAGELRLHRRRRDGLFQAPADAGAARRRPSRSTTSRTTPRRREEQEACVDAVRFKCDVLWAQLDAL